MSGCFFLNTVYISCTIRDWSIQFMLRNWPLNSYASVLFFATLTCNGLHGKQDELQARVKGQIPKATASANSWAFNVCKSWAEKKESVSTNEVWSCSRTSNLFYARQKNWIIGCSSSPWKYVDRIYSSIYPTLSLIRWMVFNSSSRGTSEQRAGFFFGKKHQSSSHA